MHVLIQATERSGSNFFNCKKCFSIFSLVVFDATYEFTSVDIDEAGWQSNSGIYSGRAIVVYIAVVIWVRQLIRIYSNFLNKLSLKIIVLQKNSLMFLLLAKHLL